MIPQHDPYYFYKKRKKKITHKFYRSNPVFKLSVFISWSSVHRHTFQHSCSHTIYLAFLISKICFFFFFSRKDSLKVTLWFESYVTFVLFRMSQTKECIWTLRSFRVILLITGEQAACLFFFLVKSPICYQSFHEGPANTV